MLWGNTVFGADCRTQKPSPTINWSHFYTCEYNNSSTITRLENYCARDNTVSTKLEWEWYACPLIAKDPQLFCHICECKSWIRTDGKCQTTTQETPECTTDQQCIDKMWLNGKCTDWICTNIGEVIVEEKNENKEENDTCDIKDSAWKCCKKSYYDLKLKATVCCEGILLSTNVPFIWQCIVYKKKSDPQPIAGLVIDETNAFPVLMGWLSKILVSIILLVSFIGILIGWVMISASWWTEEWANKGRKIIWNVISALALLGTSWVILKIINPNFFG